MILNEALRVLADGHTRDDDLVGFTVSPMWDDYGRWSRADYIEAWKTVRQHLGMKSEPAE